MKTYSRILRGVIGIILILGITGFYSCSEKFMVIKSPDQIPEARVLDNQPDVALVLGGGAFHGMAHVGVIKVLEDANIPIDLIIGTSAGSFVGAMYADFPYIDSLIPLVSSTTTGDVFDFSLFRSREGFISGKRLQKYLLKNLHHTKIEEFPVPFIAITTDLIKGETVALSKGQVAPSVNASCAIPGIFEPVKMYGTTFVDGGVLDNIATDIAREYHSKLIIAIDVMAGYDTAKVFNNFVEVFERAFQIATLPLKEQRLKLADVLISPDLIGMPLMSSRDNEKMYQAGIKAAEAALPDIIELLKEKGISR